MAEQNVNITLTMPDGSQRSVAKGTTAAEVAASISQGLAQKALAASVNGTIVETSRPITEDATLKLHTWDDTEGKSTFWHSSAHILAEALESFYPGIRLGIGPPIENGFYYDIDFGAYEFTMEDFAKVEAKFMELARSGETFVRKDVSKTDALAYFEQKGDPYKLELINGLNDGDITFYESGNFVDLCKGPHLPTSKVIKAVKLLTLAGAYWRGDSKNKMLTRIYGITFPQQKELDEYLHRLEEAKKRDHRKLGKELDLFSFHDAGPGFPFWHNNGMIVLNELKGYLRTRLTDLGYQEIQTPIILNEQLWHQSGHWDNYKEDMYFTDIDEGAFAVKPMNCPGSTFVYRNDLRSYRDLPLRLSEFGLVHRHELSGVLMGLFRVRAFTQDDAHIFCTPEQVEAEIITLINLVFSVYKEFGFSDVQVNLSTRPEKYIGALEVWDNAENALKQALNGAGVAWKLNEGDGAFYGPKIDFKVKDSLARTWQLGTVQLDFQMPERFDLNYIGPDSKNHRPVMIHRAILGSFERFFGILLEHTGGDLPLRLAPVQAVILPISDKFLPYCQELKRSLQNMGIRTKIDERNEKIGRKIRDAETTKMPFMLVVGEKEAEAQQVSIREHKAGDLGSFGIAQFAEMLKQRMEAPHTPETVEAK
jgi:threonyl-tRNA synthetase